MVKYNIHKDFAFLRFFPNTKRWMIPMMNRISRLQFRNSKVPAEIVLTSHKVAGYNGDEIEVLVFKPSNIGPDAPCLVYCHGGGFFLEAVGPHKAAVVRYALEANCMVIFPHYRLSLKDPFPAGLQDCYAALAWAHSAAPSLGIDPTKIAVGGDSAGGNLAACICQIAADQGSVPVCFQMLVYPVCDHRMGTASMQAFQDTPLWNAPSSKRMWDEYLKGVDRSLMPDYASVLHRADFSGMPAAYIETAEFDCLHDEAVQYAAQLQAAGIEVELNETKGTIHAYDIVQKSSITQDSFKRRIAALRRAFGR
jgi:acetyl esterase